MNNSRNFAPDISCKHSFMSLKDEINTKIKESLFDVNSLFISSSFNDFCINYDSSDLSQEGITISNRLDNLLTLEEEQALKNNSNINEIKTEKSKSEKKLSESEDDKSSSFGSKQTKTTQNEENKHKFNIGLIKYSDLLNLLNINENENIGDSALNEINKEKILLKIREKEEEMKNEKIQIKNENLRKNVCLKLYKALHFAFKKFDFKEGEIKNICLYLERKGRILDSSMNDKYKEYIENIFKRISLDKIGSN